MMWDFYCAICGGPFRNEGLLPPGDDFVYPEDREHGIEHMRMQMRMQYRIFPIEEEYCDNSVLTSQSIAWLKDLRMVGKYEHKAFLTGKGVMWDSGTASVGAGDDPNVPPPSKLGPAVQPGRLHLEAYTNERLPFFWHRSFPVHSQCFNILEKTHKHRSKTEPGHPSPLDLDMVHRAMSKKGDYWGPDLDLASYGEFENKYKGECWMPPLESLEPWYHDPLVIPVLNALDTTQRPRRIRLWARTADSAANCLSDLPVELLIHVADYLDIKSVLRLTRTCREVNAALEKNFWRRRFFADMPYLFEIRQKVDEDPSLNAAIDWRGLYTRMKLQSHPGKWDRVWWKFTDPNYKLPKNADLMLEVLAGFGRDGLLKRGDMVSRFDTKLIGIASRRRVWECAEELLDICEKYALKPGEDDPDTEPDDQDL